MNNQFTKLVPTQDQQEQSKQLSRKNIINNLIYGWIFIIISISIGIFSEMSSIFKGIDAAGIFGMIIVFPIWTIELLFFVIAFIKFYATVKHKNIVGIISIIIQIGYFIYIIILGVYVDAVNARLNLKYLHDSRKMTYGQKLIEAKKIKTALIEYHEDYGTYPESTDNTSNYEAIVPEYYTPSNYPSFFKISGFKYAEYNNNYIQWYLGKDSNRLCIFKTDNFNMVDKDKFECTNLP